ncbi:MAG: hypothetical protein WCK89_05995 [bacterium]
MTSMTMAKCMTALTLAASLTACAQGPGNGKNGGQGGGGQGGKGGKPPRQTPELMAEHLMQRCDGDKDGKLSLDELKQALIALKENRPQGGNGGGVQGGGGQQKGKGGKKQGPAGAPAQ